MLLTDAESYPRFYRRRERSFWSANHYRVLSPGAKPQFVTGLRGVQDSREFASEDALRDKADLDPTVATLWEPAGDTMASTSHYKVSYATD